MLTSLQERRRVAKHILRAEKRVRRRDVSHLDRVRQLIRALMLDALADYRRAGRFPKNDEFPWPMPSFVDKSGARCAMAHLLEMGGRADLVTAVSTTMNLAFVRELATIPELVAWLDAAGLTVDEAARIQPSYCQAAYSDCVCNISWSLIPKAVGVLEGTLVSVQVMRVDATYGDALGYVVGDTVQVSVSQGTVGGAALVPLERADSKPDAGSDAGSSQLVGIGIDGAGKPTSCSYNETAKKLPVTKQQVIDAYQSWSCKDAMAKVNSEWDDRPSCERNRSGSGSSCDTGGAPTDASIGILLAVVGALVFMRRKRA